jgi:hypothetical protein
MKELLQQNGISLAEWYVLGTLGYGCIPIEYLADEACADSQDDKDGSVTVAECKEAIVNLLQKKFIQEVTPEVLEDITTNYKEPAYGYPEVSDTDLTVMGAKMFVGIIKAKFGDDFFNYVFEDGEVKRSSVDLHWWNQLKF